MDILNRLIFHNTDYNLAICVFSSDALRHTLLEKKLISYTTFYAHRLNQLVHPDNPIEIYQTPHIDSGLSDLDDVHDHILFLAAGIKITDMRVLYDIKKIIDENEGYMAAGTLRDPGKGWFEIHHSFLLVNVKRWIRAGSPQFGSWEPKICELPVIEKIRMSDNYFQINFTGKVEEKKHDRQGWNFILAASKSGMEIFSLDDNIRKKYQYFYPEHESEHFWQAINDPTSVISDKLMPIQIELVGLVRTVNLPKIWLTNTESLEFEIAHDKKYDTVSLPAAGYKIIYATKYLNTGGTMVIYDYNQYSLDWAKHLYESDENDIIEIIKNWKNKKYFYAGRKPVFLDKELNIFTKESLESIKRSIDFFGNEAEFLISLSKYRKSKVKFIKVNIFDSPETLSDEYKGDTLVSVSNIFSTDYCAINTPLLENQQALKKFVDSIKTNCTITGQDAYCKFFTQDINNTSVLNGN